MANQTTGNPIIYDATTGASWTGTKYIKLVQWIDDAADIADDDTLVFSVNRTTVTGKLAMTANTLNNICVWEMNFAQPQAWSNFTLTTMTHGALMIWLA